MGDSVTPANELERNVWRSSRRSRALKMHLNRFFQSNQQMRKKMKLHRGMLCESHLTLQHLTTRCFIYCFCFYSKCTAKEKLWRNLTFFVAFPAIGLGMVNAYLGHMEHAEEPRPEYIPYEHLNIRRKKFPWGDGNHSLFHNPIKNALPDGYETPDPNEGKPRKHHH